MPKAREQIINTMSLSTSKIGRKKRMRNEIEDSATGQLKTDINKAQIYDDKKLSIDAPLHGVIACLSGMAQDRKENLHRLILTLGGR